MPAPKFATEPRRWHPRLPCWHRQRRCWPNCGRLSGRKHHPGGNAPANWSAICQPIDRRV